MRFDRLAAICLITTSGACGDTSARAGEGSPAGRSSVSQSVVGRWALVTLVRNGEDETGRLVTNAGAARYYSFNADGTFRIVLGDSVTETGTWSEDTAVSPKVFDHIPEVDGRPGSYVPGIFAIDGDTLRIAIIPPNPTRRHPTQFRSTKADSSWLLTFRRAGQ